MNLPVVDMPLPIRFRPPAPMTDEELFLFSARNEVAWIEREANGDIHIKPIPGTLVGAASADVICDLSQWVEREGPGELLAGAGFFLADGSMLGPRIALVSPEKWATVAHREKDGFAPCALDFVVEFNGPWNEPGEMEAKMRQWIANGVEVGWLIDPKEKSVTIYRPGDQPEHLAHPTSVQGTGPITGFELVMSRIWE
jgi:Uma2 family endonuclease